MILDVSKRKIKPKFIYKTTTEYNKKSEYGSLDIHVYVTERGTTGYIYFKNRITKKSIMLRDSNDNPCNFNKMFDYAGSDVRIFLYDKYGLQTNIPYRICYTRIVEVYNKYKKDGTITQGLILDTALDIKRGRIE